MLGRITRFWHRILPKQSFLGLHPQGLRRIRLTAISSMRGAQSAKRTHLRLALVLEVEQNALEKVVPSKASGLNELIRSAKRGPPGRWASVAGEICYSNTGEAATALKHKLEKEFRDPAMKLFFSASLYSSGPWGRALTRFHLTAGPPICQHRKGLRLLSR